MTFYTPKNLSPRQKDLLNYLGGKPYCKNIIDGENVVYRDLGAYDIEISGGHRKTQTFAIYVWCKEPLRIVERHVRLPHDHAMIKDILDDIVARYSDKEENRLFTPPRKQLTSPLMCESFPAGREEKCTYAKTPQHHPCQREERQTGGQADHAQHLWSYGPHPLPRDQTHGTDRTPIPKEDGMSSTCHESEVKEWIP